MSDSLASHNRTRSSNGPMYGDARMDCVLTIWSSSSICTSSSARRMVVPVARQAVVSNTTPAQSACILSRARSKEYCEVRGEGRQERVENAVSRRGERRSEGGGAGG